MDKSKDIHGDLRLVVFLKAPRPGTVKTRLAKELGANAACAAYQRIVETVLLRIEGVASVQLRFSPDDAREEITPWLREGWSAAEQGEGDLGERLARAFDHGFRDGVERVLVIGSDCPGVAVADVEAAARKLATTKDVVIGPAVDGGYWLIGLRRISQQSGSEERDRRLRLLFDAMPWSTPTVYEETCRRAREGGLKVRRLRLLSDIDTAEDWRRWKKECG